VRRVGGLPEQASGLAPISSNIPTQMIMVMSATLPMAHNAAAAMRVPTVRYPTLCPRSMWRRSPALSVARSICRAARRSAVPVSVRCPATLRGASFPFLGETGISWPQEALYVC